MSDAMSSAAWILAQGALVILIKKGLITPDEAIQMLDEAIQAHEAQDDPALKSVAVPLKAVRASILKKKALRPN